jgi:hypothetical protein
MAATAFPRLSKPPLNQPPRRSPIAGVASVSHKTWVWPSLFGPGKPGADFIAQTSNWVSSQHSVAASLPARRDRAGRPLYPPGRWCAPGRRLFSGRHLPLFRGQSLQPPLEHPTCGGNPSPDVIRGSLAFAHHPRRLDAARRPGSYRLPAGLLLAYVLPDGTGPLRLLPRAPHPAVTRGARQGGNGPSRTGPATTPTASAGPPTAPPT